MFGSVAVRTHRLFHNKAKATDLDNLSLIGLLAEIVQKAGKLPFGYPNGLLAKIIHLNKIKAQLSGNIPSAVPCF